MSDSTCDEILAELRELGAKFDALEVQVRKLGAEVSARIDKLSDSVKYLRQEGETRFNVAERVIRMNGDVNRLLNDQLASMMHRIRNLDKRVCRIKDDKRPNETVRSGSGVFRDGPW
jgi:hypothetical protein